MVDYESQRKLEERTQLELLGLVTLDKYLETVGPVWGTQMSVFRTSTANVLLDNTQ